MAKVQRIFVQNRQRRLTTDREAIRRLIEKVLVGEGAEPESTLEVALVRDAAMADLNLRFRSRREPTDVLAFPADLTAWPPGEPRALGEVIVSVDRACAQAAERGLRPRSELARLLVHGTLHLLGYRDDTSAGRARMRRRENHYLVSTTRGR